MEKNVQIFLKKIRSHFKIYIINWSPNPEITPIRYSINVIIRFSFKCFLFFLNKTINPTPAPVSNPAISDAIFKTLLRYKLVIITEAAQFGISPIKLDTNGPNIELFFINVSIVSSPINEINIFIIKVIINIYIAIFTVWIKLDFKIPFSWQWQCSCSHKSSSFSWFASFLFIFLYKKSIKNPKNF